MSIQILQELWNDCKLTISLQSIPFLIRTNSKVCSHWDYNSVPTGFSSLWIQALPRETAQMSSLLLPLLGLLKSQDEHHRLSQASSIATPLQTNHTPSPAPPRPGRPPPACSPHLRTRASLSGRHPSDHGPVRPRPLGSEHKASFSLASHPPTTAPRSRARSALRGHELRCQMPEGKQGCPWGWLWL